MKEECIFCQIIHGEKRADILYEDDSVLAFKDINPKAPVHILFVPKTHIRSINDLQEEDRSVISDLISTAKKVAEKQGISQTGYKLVFNVERGGGQYVFHLHLHLVGGW